MPAAGYATAVCILWVLTFIMGAWIYTKFRIYIRIPIEQAGYWKTQGFFELKEHAVTIGMGVLPAYWYFWKNARNPEYDSARKWLTVVLAAFVLVQLPRRSCHQQRPGVWIMSTTTTTATIASRPAVVAGRVGQVQDLRDRVRALPRRSSTWSANSFGLPLFTYHPATNRVDFGWAPGRSGEGPAMYWYGWTATMLVACTVLGWLATLLPENV